MSHRNDSRPDDDAGRLADLERRLRERQAERAAKSGREGRHAQWGALGVAWRMSLELVVALFVGGLIGLGLDRLFGTAPWLMVIGLGFGFAAGVRTVVRTAQSMQVPPTGTAVPDDEDD
jgi:ATP synthase protein I